jgi:hypothetical protein
MRRTQHPTARRVPLDLRRGTCRVVGVATIRETIMAKGQQKSAREKKKPKKEKQEGGMKSESSYKQAFGKK